MRRSFALAVLCTVVLVLAGCQAPSVPSDQTESGSDDLTPSEPATDYGSNESVPPVPDEDRLGYENGYWYNESLSVTTEDGLNETEREAVVARTMARVERIRGLEFQETVPVSVVSRAEYRNNTGGGAGESLRRFDNAKFEALFFVGEDRDSIAVQQSNRGESVLGYYSSRRGEIVIVSDSETPTISRGTLAHELVHALQDQQFGLENNARTRDGIQGRNGLIEGDAVAVTQTYTGRCGEEWRCIDRPDTASGGGDDNRHFGINFMLYFPYSDGPGLVSDLRERGGWSAVNNAYDDYPGGAVEVIYPERYPEWEPESVSLADRSSDDWDRVRPSTDRDRPDYAVVGPSAIAGSLAYTIADDYNESSVVQMRDVINYEDGTLDRDDPYNYDLPATDGWAGGRMHIYESGEETAYVWKTTWASEADAREFADAWEAVIAHWGGTRTAEGQWVIEEGSPYTDAIAVRVDGQTVTVVNAPTTDQLDEVHDA